jgi:hypothetical protein
LIAPNEFGDGEWRLEDGRDSRGREEEMVETGAEIAAVKRDGGRLGPRRRDRQSSSLS